jgi:Flp pilus assembly protein TadD
MMVLGTVLAARGGVGTDGGPDADQRRALQEAVVVLRHAVLADRRLVDALLVRGLVLRRLGRADEGRASWLAALALAPGRPDLVELLGRPTAPP